MVRSTLLLRGRPREQPPASDREADGTAVEEQDRQGIGWVWFDHTEAVEAFPGMPAGNDTDTFPFGF